MFQSISGNNVGFYFTWLNIVQVQFKSDLKLFHSYFFCPISVVVFFLLDSLRCHFVQFHWSWRLFLFFGVVSNYCVILSLWRIFRPLPTSVLDCSAGNVWSTCTLNSGQPPQLTATLLRISCHIVILNCIFPFFPTVLSNQVCFDAPLLWQLMAPPVRPRLLRIKDSGSQTCVLTAFVPAFFFFFSTPIYRAEI